MLQALSPKLDFNTDLRVQTFTEYWGKMDPPVEA